MARRKILIIGGGIAGAACAWALALRGEDEVLVLEGEAQLAAHSTSKNAGILRTLTDSPHTTALALETAEFLATPPQGFCDVPLVDPVGLVLVTRSLGEATIKAWRMSKRAGSVSAPSPAELATLLPHYVGEREGALLVHDEGHIDTSALFDGLVRDARRHGARFETDARVEEILTSGARSCGLRLNDGRELDADIVVIAAGGWAQRLGRGAGSNLCFEARRRHLLVTAPDERVDPRWPIVWSEPDSFYAKPESGGLMICACDQDVIDPDHCEELPEVRELVAKRATELLHGFDDARAAHFWAGMRTFAQDSSFAIGFDPDVASLFWVAGLGGHGMSTSVGVGRFAAAMLCGATLDPALVRGLSPARVVGAATR